MTKQEVASFLGVSEKTVGNYAKAGKLSVSYEPGKTSPVAIYDRTQVEALKNQQAPVAITVEVAPEPEVRKQEVGSTNLAKVESAQIVPSSNFQPSAVSITDTLSMLLERGIKAGQEPSLEELAVKPNLTVKEASRLFGRPEKEIRTAIKDDQLRPVKMLRGATGVRRADLDEWNK